MPFTILSSFLTFFVWKFTIILCQSAVILYIFYAETVGLILQMLFISEWHSKKCLLRKKSVVNDKLLLTDLHLSASSMENQCTHAKYQGQSA